MRTRNVSRSPSPPSLLRSPKRQRPHIQTPYSPGELGKYADRAASLLAEVGWNAFITIQQHPKSVHPTIPVSAHPVAPYLQRLARHGVPAPSLSPPWSLARRDSAYQRGPHPSAAHTYTQFLMEDFTDMVAMGFWTALPYDAVRLLPHLAIAPAGVVPQRERRPRPIMDYTFNGVNQTTAPLAPYSAMQFGQALQRVLQRIAYSNPAFGPVYLAKLDLADGYYRIPLSPHAVQQLAVVLPADHEGEPLIGLPLSLPMGWGQSPPYFCAFTETCADMANAALALPTLSLPVHPLEAAAQTTPLTLDIPPLHPVWQPEYPRQPLAYIDVYIDDFILAAQRPRLDDTLRSALHNIQRIFCDSTDSPRRAIISQSKLSKGDASWATHKRVLGWDINTVTQTLHLPSHRLERINTLIQPLLRQSKVSRTKWQQLLGELRSMVNALHSSRYLFSILQHALSDHSAKRLRLNKLIKCALHDWLQLATSAARIPAPIAALVPTAPHAIGATDACAAGMGGFWLPTAIHPTPFPPMIWRAPFPPTVGQHLVSSSNLTGTITNSDLELMAFVAGHAMLPPTDSTTSVCCATDNANTWAWVKRGSPSSTAANAFLLRHLAAQCRTMRSSITPYFTPGSTNDLADFCSRAWHLDDAAFLSLVNCRFPLQQSWTLVRPSSDLLSKLNSALSRRLPAEGLAALDSPVKTQPGPYGKYSVANCFKTQHSPMSRTPSRSCASLRIATEMAPWLPPVLQCALAQWKEPFAPLARRWPSWDYQTPVCNHPGNWNCAFKGSSEPTLSRTTHQLGSNQSPCLSSTMLSPTATCGAPQKRQPQPTCSSWASSFSFAQENMPHHPTPIPPPSASRMSTSFTTSPALTSTTRPNTNCTWPLRWPWNSPHRKTGSGANSSDWGDQAIRNSAPFAQQLTAPCIYASIAPHNTLQSIASSTAIAGDPSTPRNSRPRCAPRRQPWAPLRESQPQTSPPGPFGLQAQWPSYVHEWTPMSSASSAVGGQTKCFATSTSKHYQSSPRWLRRCSTMAPFLSSPTGPYDTHNGQIGDTVVSKNRAILATTGVN